MYSGHRVNDVTPSMISYAVNTRPIFTNEVCTYAARCCEDVHNFRIFLSRLTPMQWSKHAGTHTTQSHCISNLPVATQISKVNYTDRISLRKLVIYHGYLLETKNKSLSDHTRCCGCYELVTKRSTGPVLSGVYTRLRQ